ncbi:hypothetical protein PTKU15_91370 [Paraburkholderia terrae]|nr:hypothetical protein PTKU15_91370 [Paraburkholderia terrae]
MCDDSRAMQTGEPQHSDNEPTCDHGKHEWKDGERGHRASLFAVGLFAARSRTGCEAINDLRRTSFRTGDA